MEPVVRINYLIQGINELPSYSLAAVLSSRTDCGADRGQDKSSWLIKHADKIKSEMFSPCCSLQAAFANWSFLPSPAPPASPNLICQVVAMQLQAGISVMSHGVKARPAGDRAAPHASCHSSPRPEGRLEARTSGAAMASVWQRALGSASRGDPINWQGWINAPASGVKKNQQYSIWTSPR